MNRFHPALAVLLLALVVALAFGAIIVGGGQAPAVAAPTLAPTPSASIPAGPPARPAPLPTPTPSPTPSATPTPSYEDLSGVPTTEDLAHRYPIAVMLDDAPAARPQAGLAAASVVWQAPVEGSIARYMAIYQAGEAPSIGPVRSARLYFVRWAAEWKPLYLHEGGPPPLRNWLAGSQELVVNMDGQRMKRVSFRRAPHNLYATGPTLRSEATSRKLTEETLAYDPSKRGRLQPFRDGAPLADRGSDGGTMRFSYTSERVEYEYDRVTNTWLRFVDGKSHRDAGEEANRGYGATGAGPRIAPTTVVALIVPIRRSSSIDGPARGRLEADSIGSNKAWVFADGRVVAGRWEKKSETSRTRFLDSSGDEIAFPRGQVFYQVVGSTSKLDFDVDEAD